MHLNYYFITKLVPRLANEINNTRLLHVFSQDKDELILEFGSEFTTVFTIRAILKSDFTCLYFPEKFERARANSVDLFKELVGGVVKQTQCYENERAFYIEFDNSEKLVFKLFGNRSNLLHTNSDGQVVALFNRRLAPDKTLNEAALSRPLDQTYERFRSDPGDYQKMFPTFGKAVNHYLSTRLKDVAGVDERWKIIQEVVGVLNEGRYYLTLLDGVITLSLLPIGEVQQVIDDPLAAANAFCLAYFKIGSLQKEKRDATTRLRKKIRQTENYLQTAYEKLHVLSDVGRNEKLGNLLMAYLHQIPPRAPSIDVEDFYTGQLLTIRLKPELSAVKNAEEYFRKGKNEKVEIERLQENIAAREHALHRMIHWLNEVEEKESVRELRQFLKQNEIFERSEPGVATHVERFRKETFMGYEILVGKSARNNDELTLKYAHKEDLWLHAKDVTGSHVVIRQLAGRPVPAPVIERAAELAAWHSKRRTDSLCPVIVTPRKYVRKAKGMPAGAVLVEKESVVMVVPRA